MKSENVVLTQAEKPIKTLKVTKSENYMHSKQRNNKLLARKRLSKMSTHHPGFKTPVTVKLEGLRKLKKKVLTSKSETGYFGS